MMIKSPLKGHGLPCFAYQNHDLPFSKNQSLSLMVIASGRLLRELHEGGAPFLGRETDWVLKST